MCDVTLDEFEDLDPNSEEPTTDTVIGSFGTETFDFKKGEILYNKDVGRIFNLFRKIQLSGKQVRLVNPKEIRNLNFNLSLKT